MSLAGSWNWLRCRKWELGILTLGVALRVTMGLSFNPGWAYDADLHWELVMWIVEHKQVPPVGVTFQAYHPPLYYGLAAALVELGATRAGVAWFSIACGAIRLGIIWAGLELYVGSRAARLAALTLAAVIASSVHLDGMSYGEPLSGMLLAGSLLLAPLMFRRPPGARWKLAIALGVVSGLALLTKVSAVVVIAAIGIAALGELCFARVSKLARVKIAASWVTVLLACLAVSGWYFSRNVRDYGTPVVTSFDIDVQKAAVAQARKIPFLDRRPLGFVFGHDLAIYRYPYYPVGSKPTSRFFTAVLASTFCDYWNFSFSGLDPAEPSAMRTAVARPLTARMLELSKRAVLGGTLLAIAAACAAFVAFRRVLFGRNWGMLALLLAPTLAVLAALQFAIANPVDHLGVVKGAYLQFAAPPLYALFGLAVGWAQQKPLRWPLFSILCLALWLVASYTLYCRARILLVPLTV